MVRTLIALLHCCILLLSGPAAIAAEAEAPQNNEVTEPASETDDNDATDQEAGAVIQGGLVIEEDTAAESETTDSDDRFIPTTQISEDLSVSFPVDI